MSFNITFRRAKLEKLIKAEVQTFPPKLGWYRKVSYSSIFLIVLSECVCVLTVSTYLLNKWVVSIWSCLMTRVSLGKKKWDENDSSLPRCSRKPGGGTMCQTHGSHHALIKLQHPADPRFLDWLSRHCILENNTIAIPHRFTTAHFCKDIFYKLQRALRYFLVLFFVWAKARFWSSNTKPFLPPLLILIPNRT